jgi:hypothetical protein
MSPSINLTSPRRFLTKILYAYLIERYCLQKTNKKLKIKFMQRLCKTLLELLI